MKKRMTREQLFQELGKMRRQLQLLEECNRERQTTQARYDKLLESAPDAMLFIDREARIVLVNAQAEQLFGYREEDLVGKDFHLLIPEKYRRDHKKNVVEYFLHPRVRNMGAGLNIYGLKQDGTEFPADISLSPIETNGDFLVIASVRDITERKQAELQIERNYRIQTAISSVLKISLEPISLEEQLNKVLGLILTIPGLSSRGQGSVYIVENEPEVLVLKAWRTLPEMPPPCARIPLSKCLCGKDAATCAAAFTECGDGQDGSQRPARFPHGFYCLPMASTGKTLGLIIIPIEEGREKTVEEERFLTAVADTLAAVTMRRQAEMEKSRLKEELAEAEKRAALGRITAGMTDKIRNPLTAVGGFVRRLDKKLPEGSQEKGYVKFILAEVDRLENILRNVLFLSWGPAVHPERCDLKEIVGKALGLLEELCKEHSIAIERSLGEVPPIEGEKELLLVVVENIIVNAVDAMPQGGRLTVATGTEMINGAVYVTVRVSDTGEGIKKEDLSRIFEPFFTTKISTKRIGLGLAIAKRVLDDHKGWIRVESTAGAGASFVLYLPSVVSKGMRPGASDVTYQI
ncbi:MAG: PAS domain S-box protein [Deltaproteobacteria bacterium]|nr:PAS domain S-box protein [Deltaproteobacteria bacterium]